VEALEHCRILAVNYSDANLMRKAIVKEIDADLEVKA